MTDFDLNQQLEFEQHFKELTSQDDKLFYIARQVYAINLRCEKHSKLITEDGKRLDKIEADCRVCGDDAKQKAFNYTGIAGFLAAVGAILWEWLGKR